jgi:hypothetical protein
VLGEHLLNLQGRHVGATGDDHIAPVVDQIQGAGVVEGSEIAGAHPPFDERGGGHHRIAVVPPRRRFPPPQPDLADLPGHHRLAVLVQHLDLSAAHRVPRQVGRLRS